MINKITKYFLLIAIFVCISISNLHPALAQNTLKVDANLVQSTSNVGRVEKVVLIPVKRVQNVKVTPEKYAKEIAYYFPRSGLKGNSVNYIIFQNAEVFQINNDFQSNLSASNLSSREVVVVYVYDNSNDLMANSKVIDSLSQILNENIISISDIDSIEDIEMRAFDITSKQDGVLLNFGELSTKSSELRNSLKDKVDFSKKKLAQLKVDKVNINSDLAPNTIVNLEITLKNESDFNAYFGKTQAMYIKSAKDSPYFVSDSWANTRTALMDSNGLMTANSVRTYLMKIKTPILPGQYKENFSLYLNDKELQKFDLDLKVADNGIKVLKVRQGGIDFLTVRKDANLASQDIGRASPGSLYSFTESKNGFYKIDFNGKEGWVSNRYVEIIKAK